MKDLSAYCLSDANLEVLLQADPDLFDGPVERSALAAFVGSPSNLIAVVERGGEVVAFASGHLQTHPDKPIPSLYVAEVSTLRGHRRQGNARRALEALFAAAKERGAEGAWIATTADNQAARALYDAMTGRVVTEDVILYDVPL